MKNDKRIIIPLILAVMATCLMALAASAGQNPFNTAGTDSYSGKWKSANCILIIYKTDGGEYQGTIKRKDDTLAVTASLFQGDLVGRMNLASESFPIKMLLQGDKIQVSSGSWKDTLSPADDQSFAGGWKKDALEIELNKGKGNTYMGGLRMNGKVYIIDAKARQGILWGTFSPKNGEGWPFFIHKGDDGKLSFHTGQFVQSGIVTLAEVLGPEEHLKRKMEKWYKQAQKGDLGSAIIYVKKNPDGEHVQELLDMTFYLIQKKDYERKQKEFKDPYRRTTTYTYDQLRKTHETSRSKGKITNEIIYKYNDDGIVTYSCTTPYFDPGVKYTSIYNDIGDTIERINENHDGEKTNKYKYICVDKYKVQKLQLVSNKWELIEETVFNSDGSITEMKNREPGSSDFNSYTYKYDENGRKILEQYSSKDTEYTAETTWTTTEQGEEAKTTTSKSKKGLRSSSTEIIKYDKKGRIIYKSIIIQNENGKETITTDIYNEKGNIIKHRYDWGAAWREVTYDYIYKPVKLRDAL